MRAVLICQTDDITLSEKYPYGRIIKDGNLGTSR